MLVSPFLRNVLTSLHYIPFASHSLLRRVHIPPHQLVLASHLRSATIALTCCAIAFFLIFPSTKAECYSNQRPCSAQDDQWQPHRKYEKGKLRFRALTWNVENLFDTLHDEGFHDEEFLPSSPRQWNSSRYWRKQGAIARTLVAAADQQPIDLIALCEIENDSVVDHLCRRTRMARLGYEYLVTHSQDRRGVDVALLYQPTTLQLISRHDWRIPHNTLRERPTRDILSATFRLSRGDTLDVIVAHLPSRLGGSQHSAPYRLRAAGIIAHIADSVQHIRQRSQLIVMGDFNDEPADATISTVLSPYLFPLTPFASALSSSAAASFSAPNSSTPAGSAARSGQTRSGLPDKTVASSIEGTYFYRHQWSRIDQILVSHSLCSPSAPLFTRPQQDVHIFAPMFLLERNTIGELHPRRAFLGAFYHGGVSDHLPLFADFWY